MLGKWGAEGLTLHSDDHVPGKTRRTDSCSVNFTGEFLTQEKKHHRADFKFHFHYRNGQGHSITGQTWFFSQLKSNEAHFLFQLCQWMLQWATTECFWTRELWCLKGYRCSNAAAQLINTASLRTQHSEAKYLNFRAWRREGFIMESRKDNRWLVLKKPELLEGFQQSPFKGQVREGCGWFLQTFWYWNPLFLHLSL